MKAGDIVECIRGHEHLIADETYTVREVGRDFITVVDEHGNLVDGGWFASRFKLKASLVEKPEPPKMFAVGQAVVYKDKSFNGKARYVANHKRHEPGHGWQIGIGMKPDGRANANNVWECDMIPTPSKTGHKFIVGQVVRYASHYKNSGLVGDIRRVQGLNPDGTYELIHMKDGAHANSNTIEDRLELCVEPVEKNSGSMQRTDPKRKPGALPGQKRLLLLL